MSGSSHVPVRIWDVPVRLFHWFLASLVAISWWTAEKGPGLPATLRASLEMTFSMGYIPWMEWHRISGYAIIAVILFRVLWGFWGSETARFRNFLPSPGDVVAYARKLASGPRELSVGHSPLGAWSVMAMMLVIIFQTVLGLFSVDVDGIESGPLSGFVSFDTGRLAAGIHELVFSLVVALIVLHLVAIVFYELLMGQNLVGPMITGRRRLPQDTRAPAMAPLSRAILLAVISVGVVFAVANAFWLP